MKIGKPLPYSVHTIERRSNQDTKRCSPLAFSSFFNDRTFIDWHTDEMAIKNGLLTNNENKLLERYSSEHNAGFLNSSGRPIQQFNIFETNAKFRVPMFVLGEIFEGDSPENGKAYAYFINAFSTEAGGLHKYIVIHANGEFYIIDSLERNVMICSPNEMMSSNILYRLTNLSVLMFIDTCEFVGGVKGYDIELFKHII